MIAIGGYLISFGGHKSSSIWFFFAGGVLLLLSAAFYLQGAVWKEEEKSRIPGNTSLVIKPDVSPTVSPPASPVITPDVPTSSPPSVFSPTRAKSTVNENHAELLTPEHILTAIEEANTSSERDSVRKLYLGVSVENWKLRFNSVSTSDGKHLSITCELDDRSLKPTLGIVIVSVPLKGNEFLRTAKKGDRFIVSGDISEVSVLYIALEKGSLRRTEEN